MEKILDFQDFNLYSVDDHRTWATLCNRHRQLHAGKLAKEYLSGLDKLQLDHESIVDIAEVSNKLKSISGWTLVPVTGLLSTKDFFLLLAKKTYPITVYIRKPSEMDFSEQPDIFHDVFGHLPLLTDEKFTKFLTAYSIIALKYINNEKAIDILGRLYWFTYEMGLIREDGECKPYGGAVITSVEEILNVSNEKVPKHSFDVDHIFKSLFDSFKIQLEYFVIDSFDDLFSSLATLEQKLIGNLLIPDDDFSLRNYSVNIHLGRGFNDVIGFLNGIQFQFPNALSFVAGQPDETFFEVDDHISKYNLFVNYLAEKTGQDKKTVINGIGQYNKTKGIINEIISDYLKNDENITIKPENTIITAGAQEAFSIIVSAICNREDDVILMENPSYIGVSSFAKIFDYKIGGISCDEEGINLEELKNKVIAVNNSGKRVKLVYVIPDYQNPSGSCMPIGNRLKLLELAYKYNFLIIEDSVYNSFTYAQKKNPTLKSLDKFKRVIYVGSFSKSIFPGLRIGLIGSDQTIENESGKMIQLIDELVKVKAQLTNNTSTISQAILGGVLLDLNCSLSDWSKPKFESYKRKRDQMIAKLNQYIGAYSDNWAADISWNIPDGGFFIKMNVPFSVDNGAVFESASKFNVIFCPMRNFYLNGGGENQIRLTFSNLSLNEIELGIRQLSFYLKYKVESTIKNTIIEMVN